MNTFFRINLPFGIRRNQKNEWAAFNREYLPIGYHNCKSMNVLDEITLATLPIFSKYVGLTEQFLTELAGSERVLRDDLGNIKTVYLYGEMNSPLETKENWDTYSDKLFTLAVLKVPSPKSKYKDDFISKTA
jgi:hypothetical protein